MLKVFYTNARLPGGEQRHGEYSIGGWVANTEFINNSLNNLFSNLGRAIHNDYVREIKCLAIQNNSDEAVDGITIFFRDADGMGGNQEVYLARSKSFGNLCQHMIGYGEVSMTPSPVKVAGRDNLYPRLPLLNNPYQEPMGIAFQEASEANPLQLPSLAPNAYLGLWIRRQCDATQAAAFLENEVLGDELIQATRDEQEDRERALIPNRYGRELRILGQRALEMVIRTPDPQP